MESERLRVTLAAVLAVGNALNSGTHYGNALAIRIDSLPKLSALRVSSQSCLFAVCHHSIL